MTKQATLGPIDPSVTTPLNPQQPGAQTGAGLVPVSVEDMSAFLRFADETVSSDEHRAASFAHLAASLHPLVLGSAYRARAQIRMLGERLLQYHMPGSSRIAPLLDFLCGESGSHNYTINRREATELGLPVVKPSESLYQVTKALYDDLSTEMEFLTPFVQSVVLGDATSRTYECVRGVAESLSYGSHRYLSCGTLTKRQIPTPLGPQEMIQQEPTAEGWTRQ